MRLGFDVDGVVCNMAQALVDHINKKYELNHTIDVFQHHELRKNSYVNSAAVNRLIVNSMLENVVNNKEALLNLEPYDDSARFLQHLRRRGHLLFFITSRPQEQEEVTALWLRTHGIPFDGLFVVGSHDKGRYGRMLNLDFYIDDCLENLESMYLYKHRWRKGLALFDRPWNENLLLNPERFVRLYDWLDILRHLGIAKRNDIMHHA